MPYTRFDNNSLNRTSDSPVSIWNANAKEGDIPVTMPMAIMGNEKTLDTLTLRFIYFDLKFFF